MRRRVSRYCRTSPGSKRSSRPTYTCGNPQRQRLCTWRTVQRKNAETSSTVQSFSVERGVSMRASMPTAARQLLAEPSGTPLNVGSTRQIRMHHRTWFFIGARFSRDKNFRTLLHCCEGAGWWVSLARLESPELRAPVPAALCLGSSGLEARRAYLGSSPTPAPAVRECGSAQFFVVVLDAAREDAGGLDHRDR